jgi:hypothetical protein
VSDTINDVMYAALKDAGFDDQLTAMLMLWRDSLGINGWQEYVDHVFANTTAENFTDAEYEFWLNYAATPSFLLLEDGTSFLLLEDGTSKLLLESGN